MNKEKKLLRFARSKNLGCHFEIINDVFEQGISVLNNDGSIETFSFNNCTGSSNSETLGGCIFLKPCKKKTIAIGLTTIAVIAHIKKYVKIFLKKLVDNSQNCLLNFWVVGRAYSLSLFYDKLISMTTAKRRLFFERNSVVNSLVSLKDITAPRRKHDVIDIMLINTVERKLNHSDTIVPFMPLRFHSSSMRFCAACLISSERLKRANASSYVIFFFSIITVFLIFLAAKINIIL